MRKGNQNIVCAIEAVLTAAQLNVLQHVQLCPLCVALEEMVWHSAAAQLHARLPPRLAAQLAAQHALQLAVGRQCGSTASSKHSKFVN